MKVLLAANTDWYLYNFRLPLAEALRGHGHEVVLVSPPGRYASRLVEAGFRWIPFPFRRFGVNPFSELRTLVRWLRLYRRERPDLVHHFTIKCVLYGSIATRLAGIRSVVNGVTGLGYVFIKREWRARMLRPIVGVLYRLALGGTHIIFQNEDDRRRFRETGLVSASRSHLVRGSGVDIRRLVPCGRECGGQRRTVLFASRLLWAKGIGEFVEAARLVRRNYPDVVFRIAGDVDQENPDTVSLAVIEQWKAEGQVEFLGHRDDMQFLLQQADVVVLPSYREGVPRILVEAAACGLPLVAADVPGCRDIVRHGMNGFLVPVRDSGALARAIETLLADDDLCLKMGEVSRKIACEEFSEERVISETLEVYRAAGLDIPADANSKLVAQRAAQT